MKKVFQNIVDKNHGNCMQASIASLFNMELDEVPNFIEMKNGGLELMNFFDNMCGGATYINRRSDIEDSTEFLKKVAKFDGGINGYFYASVPSQTFNDVSHAVIINDQLEIIHDPNPNQKALALTADDVEGFYVTKLYIIGKTGKLYTKEDWEAATEEQKDSETWHVTKDENGNLMKN